MACYLLQIKKETANKNLALDKEMSTKQEHVEDNTETSEEAENQLENRDDQAAELDEELIVEQQNRIQQLEEEIEQIRENHLRKAAEMDNMRKRLHRERQQIFQTAREAAIEEFLPISDDLVRTLNAMKEGDAKDAYVDGVELIASKFDDVLAKYGVERISETGVPFNVDFHDALLRQKSEDAAVESGTVLQVIENGYKMGDKTLRHAKVIVSE